MRSNSDFKIYFLEDPLDKIQLEEDIAKKQGGFKLYDAALDFRFIITATPELGPGQLGVFAAANIAANVTLGSCQGKNLFGVLETQELNKMVEQLPQNDFLWQKDFDNGTSIVIDLEKQGSALRFVNHSDTPNVVAIFNEATNSFDYRTIKPVNLGEELLVSYGENFFLDKEKINYNGTDLKSLLLSLGKSHNLSLELSDPLTIEKIEKAAQAIQNAKIEFDFNFTANEMEISSNIEINEENLEAYETSNVHEIPDQNPKPNDPKETSLSQFSIFKGETLAEESNNQTYLFVDKQGAIQPIQILADKKRVLLINKQKPVPISSLIPTDPRKTPYRLLRHCLVDPTTGNFLESNMDVTVEDTDIITNQYGKAYRFWVTDHSGNKTEVCKKLKTEGKPNKRAHEGAEKELPAAKKPKTKSSKEVPIDLSDSINQDKDKDLYVIFEDSQLHCVKLQNIDSNKYYKFTFDENSGRIITKHLIESPWRHRFMHCLINPWETTPHNIKYIKPEEKKYIELKNPSHIGKRNQYSNNMKCWHTGIKKELVTCSVYGKENKDKYKDKKEEDVLKKVAAKH